MSRSRRRTPIAGITTAESEKQDKRFANRALRRLAAQILGVDPEVELLPHCREVTDVWAMAKDGKLWFGKSRDPKLLRK